MAFKKSQVCKSQQINFAFHFGTPLYCSKNDFPNLVYVKYKQFIVLNGNYKLIIFVNRNRKIRAGNLT